MQKIKSSWVKAVLVGALLIMFYRFTDDLSGTFDGIKSFLRVFTPCVIGVVIAFFLSKPTEKIENAIGKCKYRALSKRKKGLAVLAIYLLIILIISLSVNYIIPGITKNIKELAKNAPSYLREAEKFLSENEFLSQFNFLDGLYDRFTGFIEKDLSLDKINGYFETINKYIGVVSGAVSSFMNFFLGVVFSVYILLQKERIRSFSAKIYDRIVTGEKGRIIKIYVHKTVDMFYSYFSALALDAVVVGTVTAVVLGLFRVPYAVLLGLIVAIGNMVPFFGPIVSAVVIYVITAIAFDPFKAIWVIVFQLVLGQLDGNLIQPKILGKSIGVNPLLVLFSVVVFGDLFGFLGMIMGVPVIAAAKMILDDYLDNGKIDASKCN